jgi:hypothetical protein
VEKGYNEKHKRKGVDSQKQDPNGKGNTNKRINSKQYYESKKDLGLSKGCTKRITKAKWLG